VTIPVSARLTAHRKSACWALRRLDGSTTNCAISREVSARKGPTLPTTNRDGVSFHSDYIPLPRRLRRSALAESGQHGGVDPNFPAYSGRTQRHPIRFMRLRRSQACDPKDWRSPKRCRFDTPTGYTTRTSEPRFRRSEALSSTWWQVKDSNLRSFRDGFTDHRLRTRDQHQRLSPDKLPGVFPTDSRRQPTTAVVNRTPPTPSLDAAGCRADVRRDTRNAARRLTGGIAD